MDRLTKHWGNNYVATNLDYDFLWEMPQKDFQHFEAIIKKLAYYEDLEEQGRLVTLPCKVGDSFFTFATICLCPESEHGCDTYNGCDVCPYQSCEIAEWKFKSVVSILNSEPKFGKTMFLTREEAEAAINKKVALRGSYEYI